MRRTAILLTTLAVLGVAAALGMGLAANAISGESIGLSAKPLRAGEALAPAAASRADRAPRTTTTSRTTTTTTPRRTTTTTTPTRSTRSRAASSRSVGSPWSRGR
ncbi:MAG: hypothetical protein QOC64_3313 [Solirubrobacteraceae bacterium]|nr:hypothetical protein [Solirubrobacteraceae bacterium]